MILYFSTTGNTQYIANKLGKELSTPTLDLAPYIKGNKELIIDDNGPLIICSPIYLCTIPLFVTKYLRSDKVKVNRATESYFIFTSGGYDGIAPYYGKKIAKKLKLKYKGSFNFNMPRNYTVSKHYPVLDNDVSLKKIKESTEKLSNISQIIKENNKIKHRHVFLLEYMIILPFVPFYSKTKLTTKQFYSTDMCVGCGLCQKKCPLNVITMKDNKPIWNKPNCSHCMGCINNCPKEAIEFGEITKGVYRYTFNKVTKK